MNPDLPNTEEITRQHEWEPSDGERARVGPRTDDGPVAIVAYDPTWPASYALVAERIRFALGDRVLDLDHVGSTSVPGLPAKAVIDVDLVVADDPRTHLHVFSPDCPEVVRHRMFRAHGLA